MTIELKVLSFQKEPVAQTQQLTVDELGAKVGRSPSCALCLSDPARSISREQFEIVCRNQKFVLIDRGTNPTLVNGRPLGNGASVEIKVGDTLAVGDYELEVGEPAQSNPLAGFDLFGSPSEPENTATAQKAPVSPERAAGNSFQDDDWDFLAPTPSQKEGDTFGLQGDSHTHSSAMDGFGGASGFDVSTDEPSVDSLFDLGDDNGQRTWDSDYGQVSKEPFKPASSDDFDDLFADLGPAKSQSVTDPLAVADHGLSSLNEPMQPMRREKDSVPVRSELSADSASEVARQSSSAVHSNAWQAFEKGLGFTVGGAQITAEQAEQCGLILRNSLLGVHQLLQARAMFKREVRAEMTVIMAKENNPLKISPNIEVAMENMLSSQSRGYKSAEAATQEAYDDLLSHQTGMIAGLKAALDSLLQNFNPERLETQFNKKSLLTNLVPAAKKAKSWEVFCSTYETISKDAVDDFHKVFGEAFLKAYEQCMDDLANKGRH